MKITQLAEFNNALKSGTIPSFWYFGGSEEYLKSKCRRALLKKLVVPPEARQTDYTEFEMAFIKADEIEEAVSFFPLIASRRVVVLRGFNPGLFDKAAYDSFSAAVKNLPPSSVFIISDHSDLYGKIRKTDTAYTRSRQIAAIAEKTGVYAEFMVSRYSSDLNKFVFSQLSKYGSRADRDVCELIAQLCDNDMQAISNECAKLGAYASGEAITEETVRQMVPSSVSASAFDLVNAVINGKPKEAVRILTSLVNAGAEPVAVSAAVISTYTELAKASCARAHGASYADALQGYGYTRKNEWKFKRAWSQSSRLRPDYAEECLRLALRADQTLKSSKINKSAVIIRLIADLCLVKAY